MEEKYISYTFSHSDTTNVLTIQAAYDSALTTISDNGGTPLSTTSFKKGNQHYVTIIYKESKFN